jgi:hypothetical protein
MPMLLLPVSSPWVSRVRWLQSYLCRNAYPLRRCASELLRNTKTTPPLRLSITDSLLWLSHPQRRWWNFLFPELWRIHRISKWIG